MPFTTTHGNLPIRLIESVNSPGFYQSLQAASRGRLCHTRRFSGEKGWDRPPNGEARNLTTAWLSGYLAAIWSSTRGPKAAEVLVFGSAPVAAHFYNSRIEPRHNLDQILLMLHDLHDVLIDEGDFIRARR